MTNVDIHQSLKRLSLDYHHLVATDALWYTIFVKAAKMYSLQGGFAVYLHMKDHYNFSRTYISCSFLFPFKKFRTESHNIFIPEIKTDY